MSNNIFKKDLYRYFGGRKETLKEKIYRPLEIRYLYYFRKLQQKPDPITKIFCHMKLRKISKASHIQIPWVTKIGEGFYIGHTGRVIISPKAVIGKNVNVATGVTIGAESRGKRKGAPTIGDECWIGTNSVVVGNIKVGNDVLIAPLTLVNFDVPDHSIVIGNPAKIIARENATEGYINKKV